MVNFIHIGLNKTASTWLQKGYFANHPQLRVLGTGKQSVDVNRDYFRLNSSFVQGADLTFDKNRFKREVGSLFETVKNMEGNARNNSVLQGLSAEAYCGDYLYGKNTRYIANCLHEMFGETKIIIFLREQLSMLESNYKQFIKRGGIGSMHEFLFSPILTAGRIYYDAPLNSHIIEYFKYSRIVKLYQDVFGAENVFVGLYEDIKSDPQMVLNDLSSFLGINKYTLSEDKRYNVSPSPAALSLLKWINRFFCTRFHHKYGKLYSMELIYFVLRNKYKRFHNFRDNPYLLQQEISISTQHKIVSQFIPRVDRILKYIPFQPDRYRINILADNVKKFLIDEYKEDNKRLQKLITRDLKSSGYIW